MLADTRYSQGGKTIESEKGVELVQLVFSQDCSSKDQNSEQDKIMFLQSMRMLKGEEGKVRGKTGEVGL
ncbi:hypothetical protein VNO77_01607 [Canavalia gladiata]|uniref:Uncharacterized protein n=1 Tax=Canavalia gladiata TaxID=3824 RepID=A0AAN9R2A7_CANGL